MAIRAERAGPLFWDGQFAWEDPRALVDQPTAPHPPPEPFPPEQAAPVEPPSVSRPRPRRVPRARRPAPGPLLRARRATALLVAAVVAVAAAAIGGVAAFDAEPPALRPETEAREPRRRTLDAAAPQEGAHASYAASLGRPADSLRPGQRGPAVRTLQSALAALGAGALAVDGVFGAPTQRAVVAFQRDHGLAADGVAGPATVAALGTALRGAADADAATIRAAIGDAVGAGRLQEGEARRHRDTLARALAVIHRPVPGQTPALAGVLDQVAAAAPYGPPEARALFSTLAVNVTHAGSLAAGPKDVVGEAGVVYRFVAGLGFQLHPMASFARLNEVVRAGGRDRARSLANALVAQAAPGRGGGLLWPYRFPFRGASPPWTSGVAQAVAADALVRAGDLLDDGRLRDAARAAIRSIPGGSTRRVAGGRWIAEHDFSDALVLNAQLQSIVSLANYGAATADPAAARLVDELLAASRALLPRFDAGCWSIHALEGRPATAHDHAYHVSLLRMVGAHTGEPRWGRVAARWARSLPDGAGCARRAAGQ